MPLKESRRDLPSVGEPPKTSPNSPLMWAMTSASSRVFFIESAISRANLMIGSTNAFSSSVISRFSPSAC